MKVAILTKSIKYGNYCVAGINYETGEWVRLVSDDASIRYALTDDDITYDDDSVMEPFDLVNVEILGKDNNWVQPENYIINRNYYFTFIRKLSLQEILSIHPCEARPSILGNQYCYVSELGIGNVGYSLTIVHVRDFNINKEYNNRGELKTKASFIYNRNYYQYMSITDPEYYNAPAGTHLDEAVLVISIGTPSNGKYYKFVSAVYPV